MRQIRLYCKGNDQHTFERFLIPDLATDDYAFKRFVFLLGADRIVPLSGECHLDELRAVSEKADRELTKEFYLGYANMREDAFEQICTENSDHSRHALLSATQKLLDRVLFCAFCEDRGLLPKQTLDKAFEHHDPYNPKPVWENFRGLFRSIDAGNEALKIPQYNGGLFAEDEILDFLTVPDAVCRHFKDIGEYDYRSIQEAVDDDESESGTLVDVDILGHIFEQSITDLEQLRNELDGLIPPQGKEKHKTRRKKEGAFYTPAFITRYIIEQTLGAVLEDRFEALRSSHQNDAKGTAVKSLDDPRVYDLDELNKPQREALTKFWEAWQDELATVRILDPACGSGAFLIEAFDQLHTTYQTSNDRLEEIRGHRTLFDLDRQILQNNLYGVDLNEEAIQICRLSLWIKTAQRGKLLTSLDHTIRVGNSVVDDPDVHPLAFDWNAAFPEVAESGGFDVVVGNPPYIRQEWLKPYKSHWENLFKSFHGAADIYVYFFELGLAQLRPKGRLGFITSGSWVRGQFGGPLRAFLAANAQVVSIVDFGEYQPFEGAEMIRPSICVFRKTNPGGNAKLFKWLTNGSPPENLSDVISNAPHFATQRLGGDTWNLETDRVIELREKLAGKGKRLAEYVDGQIYRGITTGLNDAFVIDDAMRAELVANDSASEDLIKPFVQGTHLRPWYTEENNQFLIFTRRGIRIEDYPAIHSYLESYRERLEPKPSNWSGSEKWRGRKPGRYQWYEIQDSTEYWPAFDNTKIIWPDISKLPRFSMDSSSLYLGNTGYIVPVDDYFLLGVLSSWATWFFISKTAQPLRLRGNRWQYRLVSQFMKHVPIPSVDKADRAHVADLSHRCSDASQSRYEIQTKVQSRLRKTFGETDDGKSNGRLNNKAQAWWGLSLNQLGASLKTSFKLDGNPFTNPQAADDWEPYLAQKKAEVDRLTRELQDAETELNDRVYRLFDLKPDEIALLQREVEH